MSIPKAFISYSHDTQEHKKWVLELATRLRNNGIDAILDQFELKPGDDIPHFMESNLDLADKVLMICSNNYVAKANNGQGGVGYEKMIVTSNLMQRIDENKIIPLVRQPNGTSDLPIFLRSKLHINFSRPDDFESAYDDLVRVIHGAPLFTKPPVGNNPFLPVEKEKLNGDIMLLHSTLNAMLKNKSEDLFQDAEFGFFENGLSKSLREVGFIKLRDLGYIQYYNKHWFISEEGLLYCYENGLIV